MSISTGNTDEQWKNKCKQLKRKINQIEEASKVASLSISRGKVAVNRLKLEYSILLERLEAKAVLPQESESDDDDEYAITEGKRVIKRKKPMVSQPRDPDLPKRPLNPYLVFCDMEKERIKKEAEAEGKDIDLSKTLGELWRSMSLDDRKPYVKVYNEDKERYQRQMSEYESRNPKKQKLEPKTENPPSES
ncbi:Nhp10p [Cyberlindnera jadinii NRRL Y-1542]|uniref:HMG-box n=1 Tax=Cyberlindnera jadinii (strain ATCC 18201 / CBS 1600 / BCRC 20928 / JCM 3617 / NBRC 0987 / NRRL Y-1542) TaxID=983966 RepID=A0A1E4S193_CYBJN|nr:HMG-box [Cyberlindnera jadinii NRRL Y-1542]ODV73274.1 HMG-box [Cyberlindnera jadinii NRRL Y-1542]